tara:strand:+ start:2268 stop:3455 length:1188 start_codon:yes stop_codon:yes gene_type:complete
MQEYYVSSLDQLGPIVDSEEKSSVFIGGDLTFVALDKESVENIVEQNPDNYVIQRKRKGGKGRNATSLYVAVDKSVAVMLDNASIQGGLALDRYLSYALSLRDDAIVVGGCLDESNNLVSFEVLVVTNSNVVDYYERKSDFNSVLVDMALRSIFEKHPDHYIHWCDSLPLPPFSTDSWGDRFIGEVDFTKGAIGVKRRIYSRDQRNANSSWHPFQAASIALAGIIIFGCFVYPSWLNLISEREIYFNEIAGFEDSYRNSSQSLKLLRHRDYLLKQSNTSVDVVDQLDQLLGRVSSIEGVVIHKITVFGNQISAEQMIQGPLGLENVTSGDFIIVISVPVFDSSARVQGEQIVRNLSRTAGLSLRLTEHSKETVQSNEIEREYWRYVVIGSKPDAI